MKPKVSAEEFDRAFDAGEDITPHLDLDRATRPNLESRRVNVDFPVDLLRSIDRETFVGRSSEMAQLSASFARVATAGGGVALISGEPGVGKSRLAREFARQAHRAGAVALYGRCEEEDSGEGGDEPAAHHRRADSIRGRTRP